MPVGDQTKLVTIQVHPVSTNSGVAGLTLVLFEEELAHESPDLESIPANGEIDPRVAELEHELRATKEHLHTTIEELETANEKLQSLNEELQSANEELQSSNEELETANEELHQKIAEREQAEQALRESEERFRVALQGSPISVFNQDTELRYTWVHNPNPVFPPEAELVVGKLDSDIMPAEDAAQLTKIKRSVLEAGTGAREVVALSANGTKFFYDLTVEPLRDVNGHVVGITCAAIDITPTELINNRIEKMFDHDKDEESKKMVD